MNEEYFCEVTDPKLRETLEKQEYINRQVYDIEDTILLAVDRITHVPKYTSFKKYINHLKTMPAIELYKRLYKIIRENPEKIYSDAWLLPKNEQNRLFLWHLKKELLKRRFWIDYGSYYGINEKFTEEQVLFLKDLLSLIKIKLLKIGYDKNADINIDTAFIKDIEIRNSIKESIPSNNSEHIFSYRNLYLNIWDATLIYEGVSIAINPDSDSILLLKELIEAHGKTVPAERLKSILDIDASSKTSVRRLNLIVADLKKVLKKVFAQKPELAKEAIKVNRNVGYYLNIK